MVTNYKKNLVKIQLPFSGYKLKSFLEMSLSPCAAGHVQHVLNIGHCSKIEKKKKIKNKIWLKNQLIKICPPTNSRLLCQHLGVCLNIVDPRTVEENI